MTLADYLAMAWYAFMLVYLLWDSIRQDRRIAALESALRDLRRDHGDALRNQAAMIRDHVEATTGRPWR